MVTFSWSRRRVRISKISSTSIGASPRDGSSSMRSFGRAHEPAADREHLLFASGKVSRLDRDPFPEPRKIGENPVDVVPHLAPVAVGVGARDEVLARVEVLEHPPPLEDLGEPELDDVRRVAAVDPGPLEVDGAPRHLAPLGLEEPRDGLEGGGLAGAVGAEEGHDPALRHVQVNPLQHEDDVVVDDLDVVEGQHAGSRPPRRASAPGLEFGCRGKDGEAGCRNPPPLASLRFAVQAPPSPAAVRPLRRAP